MSLVPCTGLSRDEGPRTTRHWSLQQIQHHGILASAGRQTQVELSRFKRLQGLSVYASKLRKLVCVS